MKPQKVRIIVAFGDIEGFTAFCDSVTNDAVEYTPFMDKYDELVAKVDKSTGYTFDDTGDGFMCTVDLKPDNNCTTAIRVIVDLWILLKSIQRLIRLKESPRPDGFRVVLASGYVEKKTKRDGKVVLRGKHINMAHEFLDTARGHGMVCHQSFRELIGPDHARKNGVRFLPFRKKLWVIKVGPKLKRGSSVKG